MEPLAESCWSKSEILYFTVENTGISYLRYMFLFRKEHTQDNIRQKCTKSKKGETRQLMSMEEGRLLLSDSDLIRPILCNLMYILFLRPIASFCQLEKNMVNAEWLSYERLYI